MVFLYMFDEVSYLNLLCAFVALDFALWTYLSVFIDLRYFVFYTAIVFTNHFLHAYQFLRKFVEHNVDVRTPAGRACFFVIFDLKRAYIAQELSTAAASKWL